MKSALLACCLLSCTLAYPQNRIIDSLQHQLTMAAHDTSRILLLADLCFNYRNVKPDLALQYGKRALVLAQQINYPKGKSRSLSRLSFALREAGELPKALETAYQALSIAEQYQFKGEIAAATAMIGNVYYDLNQYSTAIQYWKRGTKLYEELGDNRQVALRIATIGEAFVNNNQLDSAVHYLQVANREVFRLKMIDFYPYLFRYLGVAQDKLANYQLALSYYRQGVQAALQIDDHRNAAYGYNLIAAFYQRSNQPDSSISYARKALTQAQAGPFNLRILESSKLLAHAYKQQQDFRQAFVYQELMLRTKESLFGAGNIQAMQTMVANEEKRQREVAFAKEAYQNQLKQYGLLVGLGVLVLTAFFLYRNNRQKHQANQLLNEQKAKVEQALETLKTTQTQLIQREKMASLGELTAGIAHEIQNPLNFVNNFSELSTELVDELTQEAQAGRIDDVLTLATDLTQNLQKITHHGQRASSIVKGMLEHARTSTGQKEPTDLNALANEYMRLAYQGQRSKDQAVTYELITDFAPNLPLVNVVPQEVGRVLLNLYNNAFYALQQKQKIAPADYQPTIKVSTAQVDGNVVIQVRDNGTGIPESVKGKIFHPFFTTKPTGAGTGLGLSLSYDIVTKGHEGELTVENRESEGTEFSIRLPFKTN